MPFQHLSVVEIGSSPAGSYCARLFADCGAVVTKIEPVSGDPVRQTGPKTAAGHSAWFAFLNFNKSSLVLDAADPAAGAQLADLIANCDVLIDARAVDAAGCPAFDLAAAKAANPALVHVDISWFGHDGPQAHFEMTDAVCRAMTGLTKLIGPADGPPLAGPDFQVGIFGGLWSFIAATSSLIGRMQTGRGRSYELSLYESCIAVAEYIMFESWSLGDIMRRIGVNRFWPTHPVGIYQSKDGWIGITTVTPAQWKSLCEMLGLPELRDDETLVTGLDRLPRMAEIDGEIVPRVLARTSADLFAEGLKRKIPMVAVPSIDDLLTSAEWRKRAIIPVQIGDEQALAPGSVFRLTGTPPKTSGTVPALGESGSTARSQPRRKLAAQPPGIADSLPLSGIRVVDFSMGWAGPLCTRTMADLGAEVIKIESCQYPDWWRGVDRRPEFLNAKRYETMPRFAIMNRGKRGITLDLTRPEGIAIAKQLVADADLVVDNYSVDVLPKLGLGYDVLSKIKPSLVMMSMSAFGSSSPYRDCRAYGSTLEQGSGVPSTIGEPDGPPTMSHTAFGDPIGGLNGAASVLIALLHARRTGQGQFIDLSQVECMTPFAGPWIVAQSTGADAPRYGRGHPDHAPHGYYPGHGVDAWVAVAVSSDAMWQRLCAAIGAAELAADPTLATAAGRRAQAQRIDAVIADWTAHRTPDEAMALLQGAGVAAGALRLPAEMLQDAQLHARGFIQTVDRAFMGPHPQPSLPFRDRNQNGGGPIPVRAASPTLGQANEAILGGLLKMDPAEIARLAATSVIGTTVLAPAAAAPKKAAAQTAETSVPVA